MQCMNLVKILDPIKKKDGHKKHLGQLEKFKCGIKDIKSLIFLGLKMALQLCRRMPLFLGDVCGTILVNHHKVFNLLSNASVHKNVYL